MSDIGIFQTESASVRWTGEIDLSTRYLFGEALDRGLAAGGDLRVDLRDVTFLGSCCVSELARAGDICTARGTTLRVRVQQPCARRVFALLRMDEVFEVEPRLTDDERSVVRPLLALREEARSHDLPADER